MITAVFENEMNNVSGKILNGAKETYDNDIGYLRGLRYLFNYMEACNGKLNAELNK